MRAFPAFWQNLACASGLRWRNEENALAVTWVPSDSGLQRRSKAPKVGVSETRYSLVRTCPHFYLFFIRFKIGGNAMAKAVAVCALCIVSAVVGAGIDHYFAVAIEQGAPRLQQAVSSNAAVAAPAEMNVEVLGDRVRCDVRYQELKISPDEYQSFKRKCMGANWDGE
jgi:hypothetical protein